MLFTAVGVTCHKRWIDDSDFGMNGGMLLTSKKYDSVSISKLFLKYFLNTLCVLLHITLCAIKNTKINIFWTENSWSLLEMTLLEISSYFTFLPCQDSVQKNQLSPWVKLITATNRKKKKPFNSILPNKALGSKILKTDWKCLELMTHDNSSEFSKFHVTVFSRVTELNLAYPCKTWAKAVFS